MKTTLFLISFCLISIVASSQEKEKLYHPEMDAHQQIEAAITSAKAEGKNILIQVGGNWCRWCIMFHKFCQEDAEITKMLDDNYITVKLNHSPENKNEDILAKYRFPQRFGFPVFVVLDREGNYLHTENSVYLEQGDGYDKKRVMSFFKNWSPSAIDPNNYKD